MKRRKSKLVWLLAILILTLCFGGYKGLSYINQREAVSVSSSGLVPDPNVKYVTAKVTSVVDGDTIHVLIDGKKETVRLILVDTPETKHPTKPIEPFGPEASQFTKDLLEGKEVKLEQDVSITDRYGRLLKYVWLDDHLVNEILLEKGLGRVAVFPPDVKYVEAFRAVQKRAQDAHLGIWSLESYVQEKVDTTVSASPSNNYKSCKEVRTAGKAPIHKGDPGYSSLLDKDGDGIGCE
jgi:micrococcal nuclease